jgi:CRP-like cAMP-binding protein
MCIDTYVDERMIEHPMGSPPSPPLASLLSTFPHSSLPIITPLCANSDNLMTLVEMMSVVEHPMGDVLARCGEPLPAHMEPESVIWVVEKGSLEVSVPVDGTLTRIDTIQAG